MTGSGFPLTCRRTRLRPLAAALVALAALAGTAHAAPGPDRADPTSTARERTKGARTVIGAPSADGCAAAAASGAADDLALSACDRALALENTSRPNLIATRINRGTIHLRRREGEAALADFDAVIALDPRNADAHLNRGAALVLTRQPALAVAAITQALSLGVRAPHKAYFNRAAARESLGDVRGAYEDYSTALSIQPDWGAAEAELARFARVRRERLAAQLDAASAKPAGAAQ